MKKFTKIIGIFLCLSMIVGMLSVVGAVDPEPTAPAAPTGAILEGDILEVVSPTKVDTLFGFYEDFTGEDEDTFMDGEDGYCVTDGWFSRAGYSCCTSEDGLIALIMTIDEVTTLGGIEIVCKTEDNAAVKFDIQVMGDVDWETVVSVEENPFTDSLTKTFTFDAVDTDTVRILIHEVATEDECYFNEVTLLEATTGKLKTVIDMNGKATDSDAHASSNANYAIDGEKATFFTGSTVTVDLGEATAIDGFNLYHYRNSSYPNNVTVNIQKTEGGDFELLGTFATGFGSGYPQDSLYVTFDQTYMAYGVQFVSDVWGYQNDYELWQYQREAAEEVPTEEPTQAPTEAPAANLSASKLTYKTLPAPTVGYYVGETFTKHEHNNGGANMVDAHHNTWGGCAAFVEAELVQNGGTKTPAIVWDLSAAPLAINGLEILANNISAGHIFTQFYIQVQTAAGGAWETVYTSAQTPFATNGTLSCMFTKDVTAYGMRIMVNSYVGGSAGNIFAIQDITPWIITGGNAATKVPAASATVGVYNDGETRANLTAGTNAPAIIDGDKRTIVTVGTGNDTWVWNSALLFGTTGGSFTPAAILTLAEEAKITSVEIYSDRDGRVYTPIKVSIEAMVDGAWTSVGTAESLDWDGPIIVAFDEVTTNQVRVLVENITRIDGNTAQWVLPEIELYYTASDVEEPPVDPTDPTQAPTEEPTQAPTEEPTQAPTTATPSYTWMDLIAESTLTPHVGYYADGDFTTLTDECDSEAAYLTDAAVGTASWVHGNTFPIPSGKTPAAVIELNATKLITAIELCTKPDYEMTAFDVDVLNESGEWQRVYSVTGNTLTAPMITFDTPVVGTAVRVIINDFNNQHPCIQEIWVYEGKTEGTLVQVPVTNVTATQDPVVPEQGIENILDGDGYTYYQIGPANMPVAVNFDTTNADGSATNVSRMRIFAFANSKYAPQDIVVDVKTSVEPETWVNVYAGPAYNLGHIDTFVLDFGATYAAYDVRLTVNSYTSQNLILTDVELFGDGEPNEPSVPTDPTDPTEGTEPSEQPTEAPTQAPTQAPTEPKRDPSELQYKGLPTPVIGYYVGEIFTKFEHATGTANKLVDDNNETWGGSQTYESGTPAGKTPAVVFDLTGNPVTINGLEIMVNDKTLFTITDFDIQIQTAAGGAWETVVTATGNPFVNNATQSFMFDETVTAYGIRIMINAFNGNNGSNFFFAIQEITPWVVTEGPAYVQVPVADAEIGVYMDGDKRAKLSEKKPGTVLLDGDKRYTLTIGENNNDNPWIFDVSQLNGNGGEFTPAAVLTLAEPTVLTRVDVYHGRDGYVWTPTVISVQVLDSTGLWKTVGTYEKSGWVGPAIVEFEAVETTQVRILMENAVRAGSESAQWILPEIQLFCAEDTDVTPDTPSEPIELPETPVVAPGGDYVIGVPTTGYVYKIVSPTKLTTVFGYYDADGAFVDCNDGACVTDGWYGRAGYSECTSADGQIALIMTLDEATTIGAIELVGKNAENNPVDFEIQALVNGEWVTVVDVNEDPFTTGMTKTFTFTTVETAQVRILVNAVSVETNQCYFNEVSLYEVTTGKNYSKIDLNGRVSASDAHASHPHTNMVDGDKATLTLLNNATINLTEAGKPTAVDGLAMYFYRGEQAYPGTVTVSVQKTEGGEFEAIGTFNTDWANAAPIDSAFIEFEETVVAYAMTISFNAYAYINELELIQYEQESAPITPPDDPTPTDPSEPATEPSEPATQPSEPATQPSEPTTEPSETPTEPGTDEPGEELDYTELEDALALLDSMDPADYTEESVAEFEAVLEQVILIMMDENATQEMIDEATEMLLAAIDALVLVEEPGTDEPGTDLPDVPTLPGAPDLTDIQATIDLIHGLNPNKYTAESYENLIIVVKEVNKILATEGGYSQKMLDRANEMLTEALAALVLVDGGADVPGGDEDLPAPTGDIALAVLTGLMSLSTVGGAVVIGKKKFF